MGKAETRLTDRMRKAGKAEYGDRLVLVKYHGDQYAKAGVSDLLGCLDGVFIAVEVKSPESYGDSAERALRDGPTVLQRVFIEHVLDAGGCAGFAATVEQYQDILDHAAERAEGTHGTWLPCEGHNT
jgi:hypothetical protein